MQFSVINLAIFSFSLSLAFVLFQIVNVLIKSKLQHPPRVLDAFSCPEGREFNELSLLVGETFIFDHHSGEFDRQPRFHVTNRADSRWVDKSRRRQTLMNSKEKITDSWRIG